MSKLHPSAKYIFVAIFYGGSSEYANDLPNHQKPGVLFIGINDNGSCANLAIDDKLLLTLSLMRSDGSIGLITVENVREKR